MQSTSQLGHSFEEDGFIYVSCKKNTTIYLVHTDNIIATGKFFMVRVFSNIFSLNKAVTVSLVQTLKVFTMPHHV